MGENAGISNSEVQNGIIAVFAPYELPRGGFRMKWHVVNKNESPLLILNSYKIIYSFIIS